MRTTIELPDELLRQAKIRAAVEGIPLKKFFIAAVEQRLVTQPKSKHRRGLPVIDTGGPQIPDVSREEIEDAVLGSIDEFLSRRH